MEEKLEIIVNELKLIRFELEELNSKLDKPEKEIQKSYNIMSEKFVCSECCECKSIDDMGESELAQNDLICKECMDSVYGIVV